MSNLNISKTADYFEYEGKGFFYFADTVWSAFTSPDFNEWTEYLDYRKRQGFNVLQINVLPQWDASAHEAEFHPFDLDLNGEYIFSKINEAYFDRACKMLQMAKERGFIPALTLLWCNYVPDTWGSDMTKKNIMPFEEVKQYTEYVVNKFKEFNPIYIISGDTDFQTEKSSCYYMTALKIVKELCPDALTTMHLGGERCDLPEAFVESKELDFYTYQSSHGLNGQHTAYHLAEAFLEKKVKRPIVNAEPCYEGHGHGNQYGRFTAFDVRKAVWQSLLSGAKAGITYGAHGIWDFHRENAGFQSEAFSSIPFNFRDALRFEGAWDIGFAKWIFETFNLFNIEPRLSVLNKTEEIRFAISKDERNFIIYVPFTSDIKLNFDISKYNLSLIELTGKHFMKPTIEIANGLSTIKMYPFNSDALIIGVKR
jgi:hypothetical protein